MTAVAYNRATRANRYFSDSLETASPTTLLVMLWDRLVLDLQRAEQAQLAGDRQVAHTNLLHAQEIIAELQSSLKVEAWEGAPGLSSLYTWLRHELMAANVSGDAQRTATCRTVTVEPLAEAWRAAALQAVAAGADGRA